MVRLYGKAPYRTVLVHGGPGAAGSLRTCAEELSRNLDSGIVEALQSKDSIKALVEELHLQITENCGEKVVLVGHSWGAWLAALYAEKYPQLCRTLVTVGCPPITEEYVGEITARRIRNLTESDREIFRRLAENAATEKDMEQIPRILEKSDNYCLSADEKHPADKADSRMYNRIWSEAADLRRSGALAQTFRNIRCDIICIQGVLDPHPVKGVTEPLEKAGIAYKLYSLEKCGHSPFMEKYAKETFYRILTESI